MNTEFRYLYRDASNYKASSSCVLAGEITADDQRMIRARLDDGVAFIPSQVGLPDQQPHFLQYGPLNDDDHVWHELVSISDTTEAPTGELSADTVVAAFRTVDEWNIAAAMERLGLDDIDSSETLPARPGD